MPVQPEPPVQPEQAGTADGPYGSGPSSPSGQDPLSADEMLDIVDEQDRVVGRSPRAEAYAKGLRHRAAFVLARDGRDRIFVHRRTARKLVFPSLYDMFVGGVVGAGETYDQAALREAEEELGVSGLPEPEPLFRFRYEDGPRNWWCAVYQVRWDGPVAPQPEEIAWHDFLTEDELADRLTRWQWVPDGLEAYHRLRALRAGTPKAPEAAGPPWPPEPPGPFGPPGAR